MVILHIGASLVGAVVGDIVQKDAARGVGENLAHKRILRSRGDTDYSRLLIDTD